MYICGSLFAKSIEDGGAIALLLLSLLLISSLYTFSRFVWLNTITAIILGILVSHRDRMHLLYAATRLSSGRILLTNNNRPDRVSFSTFLTHASDIERIWQIRALNAFFSPLRSWVTVWGRMYLLLYDELNSRMRTK